MRINCIPYTYFHHRYGYRIGYVSLSPTVAVQAAFKIRLQRRESQITDGHIDYEPDIWIGKKSRCVWTHRIQLRGVRAVAPKVAPDNLQCTVSLSSVACSPFEIPKFFHCSIDIGARLSFNHIVQQLQELLRDVAGILAS